MRVRHSLLAFLLIPALLMASLPGMRAQATTILDKINEAEQEKDKTEQEKADAEQDKNEAEGNLGGLTAQHASLKDRLSALNDEMVAAGENLERIEGQVADKEAEIAATRVELANAQETERQQYESMKLRIQFMYESQDTTYLQMLLSAGSIAEFINAADYINMIAEYDKEQLEVYQATVASVTATAERLDTEAAELAALNQAAVDEQDRIASLVQATATQVAEYADRIDDMEEQVAAIEKEIADKEALLIQQQADIDALMKQYQEELERSRLAAMSSKRDISEVAFEEGDRYLLANLIYCEAGGEPYEGQVAVGAVVINRVLSSVFSDTVSGVIYKNRQFSPVANGKLALALAQNKATESCYQAADAAMSGYTNVGGCVYFRTPIPGLEGIAIGNHIFY